MTDTPEYTLKLTCENRPGIVAAVTRVIAENQGNLLECQQFDDMETQKFLARFHFSTPAIDRLAFQLQPVIARFDIRHELIPKAYTSRIVIMVSKLDHCMHDLLYRWRKGTLPVEVAAIVSNHETSRDLAAFYDLPYHHWPVTPETKEAQEEKLLRFVDDEKIDLVVLARYMQILSDNAATHLYGKAINIHHSFLPSFIGAKPYHAAHGRGVKLIGATAHYVTADLDEGPIIEQEVARVSHTNSVEDLVRIGRDVESRALARAVTWHVDHRVFINGNKTVVFPH